jgi:hypothetical protein
MRILGYAEPTIKYLFHRIRSQSPASRRNHIKAPDNDTAKSCIQSGPEYHALNLAMIDLQELPGREKICGRQRN